VDLGVEGVTAYSGGFPSELTVPAARLLEHSEELLRLAPGLHARLTDSDDVVVARLAASPLLARLTGLDLEGNLIGPDSARALAASPHAAQLQRLYLAYNRLGDEGADALTESPNLGRFRPLTLEYNGIGPGGVRALAESPRLARLEELHLARNDIGPETVAEVYSTMQGRRSPDREQGR
jgi:hypothetical protein